MAFGQAKAGIPVGYFSLEMSVVQLIWKMLAQHLNVSVSAIRRGKVSQSMLDSAYSQMGNLPFFCNDKGGITLSEIRAISHKWVHKHGVKMIYLDYMQLVAGDQSIPREQQIGSVSRELKALAKELKIPIMVLSQMSRDVEKRGSKVPRLSDLRESGAIEQDADMVCFIYDNDDEPFDDTMEDAGIPKPVIFDIQKFRLGTPGIIPLWFHRSSSFFTDQQYTGRTYPNEENYF
jgi:replicative DNA helicase